MTLFGDKGSFALAVRPLGGPPPDPDPSASATWARIQLWVGGENLFEHTHFDTERFEDGVMWPSVYLARWFVHIWDELFYETPWPIPTSRRNARDVVVALNERLIALVDDDEGTDEEEQALIDARDRFVASHALRAASGGAALPAVYFSRHGDQISIAWRPSKGPGRRFHLDYSDRDVRADTFFDAVKGFIEWNRNQVIHQEGAASDQALFAQWLESLSAPETPRRALVYQAGLRDRWPRLEAKIGSKINFEEFFKLKPDWTSRGVMVQASESPIAMAFRCVAPVLGDEELIALRDTIVQVKQTQDGTRRLDDLGSKVGRPISTERDYEQGYSLAVRLRRELQNPDDYLDIEELLENLGVPVEDYAFGDPAIDGAAVCDERHGPIIFVNPNSRRAQGWPRRVVLAHELCHLLFDRQDAASLAIISGPWAPVRLERRANAFAIELLLPKAGIKAELGTDAADPSDDQVQQLMEKFEVGVTATTEHLRNRYRR